MRKPSYECLVDGCKDKLWTKLERYKHLVEVHKYPSSFDFDNPHQRRKDRLHKNTEDADCNTELKVVQRAGLNSAPMKENTQANAGTASSAVMAMDECLAPSSQVRANAGDLSKLKTVECRHFARGYCNLGDRCTFKHSQQSAKDAPHARRLNDKTESMEVEDALSEAFMSSVKVSIPRAVAFGRKNRKSAAFEKESKMENV
jgi:hypothetical protein